MLSVGTLAPEKRVEEWKRKRVFFLTPQVMQNDLTRSSCPAEQVVCVVFDEAHKALGNHAYCQVKLFCVQYLCGFCVDLCRSSKDLLLLVTTLGC